MNYQSTIGLEIHVELATKSKMFCSCLNDPNEKHPNVNICPICTAQPGSMPVVNQEAARKSIKIGMALNCRIPEYSQFDRKNYFYPDLPKGYQISQYDFPLCKEGFLKIGDRIIKIRRIHLEEDTGRLIHSPGKDYSLVDFNRAGVPLMELVTEPDLKSAKEAKKFAEELRLILRYLSVSDADMEKGQMRVEVNISLNREGDNKLGTKVEIKNLNSFVSVEKSIEREIERQTKILETGKKVIQETRGWDSSREVTVSQRKKEEAHDYRYFPEPDLPKLHFGTPEILNGIKFEIPELPQAKRERFVREYELDEKSIEIFVSNKDFGEYFEKAISEFEPRLPHLKIQSLINLTKNYLITDLLGLLKGASVSGEDFLITPENFAEFITLIDEGKISSKTAKQVLSEMFGSGADPSHIIEEKGLIQITDEVEMEKIVKEVIAKNPKPVENYKNGKTGILQFLVGQVMAQTGGRANPESIQRLFKKLL